MKLKGIFALLFMLVSTVSMCQKTYELKLHPEPLDLDRRHFYISEVIDSRINPIDVGFVQKGILNTVKMARISPSLSEAIQEYFDEALIYSPGLSAITVEITRFEISEKSSMSQEIGQSSISFNFFLEGDLVLTIDKDFTYVALDVTNLHPYNMSKVIDKALVEFNMEFNLDLPSVEETDSDYSSDSEYYAQKEEQNVKTYYESLPSQRSVLAIGYQIGGNTLVGIDFTRRISDVLGIHFGVGLLGFTSGLKFHTRDDKNSPFINLSYKDAGFGSMGTGALEYGGRVPLAREGYFAFHWQAGIQYILNIDSDFERRLFKSNSAPDVILAIGVGFSW